MSHIRASSSPELLRSPTGLDRPHESTLEANVKLLLRLVQDNSNALREDCGGRKPQCISEMMTILEDLRSRVQKLQAPKRAELRRCNTDLRRGAPPRDKKPQDPTTIEEYAQNLRRELFASMNARKSLEKMFCSLGKEKEIIAAELARKVRELGEAEELVENLRAQNELLLEKVKAACAAEHKKKNSGSCGGESQTNVVLQERNKMLSEQLLKALDGYRSMKRRLKDAQVENAMMTATVAEAAEEAAAASAGIVHGLRGKVGVEDEMESLEQMLAGLREKLVKVSSKKAER